MLSRLTSLACAAAITLGAIAPVTAPATAQTPPAGPRQVLSMTCMLNGQPHHLQAQVEVLQAAGAWMPGSGVGGEVIPIGEYNYYYQGVVSGPLGQFYFSGENSYGQFFSPQGGGETRARFDMLGRNQLMITLDPFGTPQRVMCRS